MKDLKQKVKDGLKTTGIAALLAGPILLSYVVNESYVHLTTHKLNNYNVQVEDINQIMNSGFYFLDVRGDTTGKFLTTRPDLFNQNNAYNIYIREYGLKGLKTHRIENVEEISF